MKRKPPKKSKDAKINWKGLGQYFLDARDIILTGYFEKGNSYRRVLYSINGSFTQRNQLEILKLSSYGEEKGVVSPRQCTNYHIHERYDKMD